MAEFMQMLVEANKNAERSGGSVERGETEGWRCFRLRVQHMKMGLDGDAELPDSLRCGLCVHGQNCGRRNARQSQSGMLAGGRERLLCCTVVPSLV